MSFYDYQKLIPRDVNIKYEKIGGENEWVSLYKSLKQNGTAELKVQPGLLKSAPVVATKQEVQSFNGAIGSLLPTKEEEVKEETALEVVTPEAKRAGRPKGSKDSSETIAKKVVAAHAVAAELAREAEAAEGTPEAKKKLNKAEKAAQKARTLESKKQTQQSKISMLLSDTESLSESEAEQPNRGGAEREEQTPNRRVTREEEQTPQERIDRIAKSLETKSLDQLRGLAVKYQLSGFTNLNKEELIGKIIRHFRNK